MDQQQTSKEAYESTKGIRGKIKKQVFDFIAGADYGFGTTCDYVEEALGISHQTASATITHLRQQNYIFDSGKKRLTKTGRKAIVWQARARTM